MIQENFTEDAEEASLTVAAICEMAATMEETYGKMMRMPKQIECGHFVRSHCSFEGIPINELFLEKNGFVYDQKEQAFCFNENQILIQKCSDEETGVSLWRFMLNSEMTIMDVSIRYIHELQHYYKLLGIKKSFNI